MARLFRFLLILLVGLSGPAGATAPRGRAPGSGLVQGAKTGLPMVRGLGTPPVIAPHADLAAGAQGQVGKGRPVWDSALGIGQRLETDPRGSDSALTGFYDSSFAPRKAGAAEVGAAAAPGGGEGLSVSGLAPAMIRQVSPAGSSAFSGSRGLRARGDRGSTTAWVPLVMTAAGIVILSSLVSPVISSAYMTAALGLSSGGAAYSWARGHRGQAATLAALALTLGAILKVTGGLPGPLLLTAAGLGAAMGWASAMLRDSAEARPVMVRRPGSPPNGRRPSR